MTVLDLSGRITLGEGGTLLKDKLHSLLHQGKKNVLLNLGEVSYVDSAGLGALVSAYTTMTREGGTLKLLNVTKKLQDLLSITKLLTVFETFDHGGRGDEEFSVTENQQEIRRTGFLHFSPVHGFRNTTIRFVFVPFELFRTPQQLAVFVNC